MWSQQHFKCDKYSNYISYMALISWILIPQDLEGLLLIGQLKIRLLTWPCTSMMLLDV